MAYKTTFLTLFLVIFAIFMPNVDGLTQRRGTRQRRSMRRKLQDNGSASASASATGNGSASASASSSGGSPVRMGIVRPRPRRTGQMPIVRPRPRRTGQMPIVRQ
jgi:hypothetical protein